MADYGGGCRQPNVRRGQRGIRLTQTSACARPLYQNAAYPYMEWVPCVDSLPGDECGTPQNYAHFIQSRARSARL